MRAQQGHSTRLFINTLCALWLWMFIHPMTTLGLLSNPNSFAPAFVVMLVSSLVPSKWIQILSMLIVTSSYALIHFQDIDGSLLARIGQLVHLDSKNIAGLMHGQALAEPLQTQLFICIVFIVFWLLIFASRRRNLWVFYNLLGIVVLCIIDMATAVHPTLAIVVNVGVCLVVLATARRAVRDSRATEIASSKGLLPTFIVILLLLGVGFASPKQGAVWGDPVNWKLPSLVKGTRQVQVIGFQTDDSHLGGAFEMNYDPVLSVVEPFPEYLRGQVLSTYTGKGWLNASDDLHNGATEGVPASEQTSYVGLPEHTSNQDIVALSNLNTDVVFGAYSITTVKADAVRALHPLLEVDDSTGTVTGLRANQGESYHVASRVMVNPYPQLKDLPDFQDADSQLYPMDVGPFLELPAELPSRVRELAQKVASGGGNEYDIVTRVENFLALNYSYDTQNIPVPEGQADYVDQFLFATKRGYCNNFSTTMAVMLRAVNIPTRWVTGFAEGVPDDTYQGSSERYIVRNADAHSWVEVYFPHYGWIPFDPTPSFSFPFAPAHVKSDSSGSTNPQTSPSNQKPGTPTGQNHHPTSSSGNSGGGGSDSSASRPTLSVVLLLALVAAILLALTYVFRKELRLRLYERIWRTSPDEQRVLRAVRLLLRLSRQSDTKVSTLRGLYVVAQNNGLEGQELRQFIQIAEGYLYGKQSIEAKQWKYLWETWRKWIRNLVKHSKSN